MKNNSFIFSVGDLYYSCLDDTSVSVVENAKYMYLEHITVPAHISYQGKEYNVTTIGKRAFHSCKCISIVLTDRITCHHYWMIQRLIIHIKAHFCLYPNKVYSLINKINRGIIGI